MVSPSLACPTAHFSRRLLFPIETVALKVYWGTGGGFNHTPDAGSSGDGSAEGRPLRAALLPAAEAKPVPRAATRGETTPLHYAAATGDAAKLEKVVATCSPDELNAGDKRQYTAFHIACAGGHVQCVRALLVARCDATLLNDAGYDGWQLAGSLHRAEVLAMRAAAPTTQRSSRAERPKRQKNRAKGPVESNRRAAGGAASSDGAGARGQTVLL